MGLLTVFGLSLRQAVIRWVLQGDVESAGVLGGHARAPHVPSAGIGGLVYETPRVTVA